MTGIICLDKPKDITSFGVVAKTRGILREKKAGHTGTLDPMATGVLPIMLGGATRFLNYLPDSDKGYRATFKLGMTTDTLDITGEVLTTSTPTSTFEDVKRELESFRGEIEQIPPMYSALSVDGQKLYKLARKGIEVERKPRKSIVKKLEIVDELCNESENIYCFDIICSKGTYVRTIIDDLGQKLGCGAVMTDLDRTLAMGFDKSKCVTLDELQEIKNNNGSFESLILNVEDIFKDFNSVYVSDKQGVRFKNGGALDRERITKKLETNELYKVYANNEFLGLGKTTDEELKVERLLINK